MLKIIRNLRYSLVSKLIISVGIILLLIISTWAYFSIKYQKDRLHKDIVGETERLGNGDVMPEYAFALFVGQSSGQNLEESGFTGSIRPDQSYPVSPAKD